MRLNSLIPKLQKRITHLTASLNESESNYFTDDYARRSFQKSIIELQIEWENIVRNVILSSATGRFFDDSERNIKSGLINKVVSREEAAHQLIGTFSKRQYEPDWYLPKQAIDAASRLKISNEATIATELGVTPWPLDDLRHLRNFLSHRSKRSAESLRQSTGGKLQSRLCAHRISTSYSQPGKMNFEYWAEFIVGRAAAIVK